MKYAVADTSTGRVLRYGACPDSALAQQAGAGQAAVDVSALTWTGHEDDYHYDGTSVAPRSAMTVTLPSTAARGAAITFSAPAGAAVSIDGVSAGTIPTGGSETISFADAGTYVVGASLWPWRDFSGSVVVS